MYWAALLIGTHWPRLPAIGPENTDKVLHMSAYGGLAMLMSLFVFAGRRATLPKIALVILILALAGGLDELTQPPFHRTADWYDWYADLAGIGLGVLLATWINSSLYRRLKGGDDGRQKVGHRGDTEQ